MEFFWLEGKFLTFPREGKFTSSHFFASKDVMGSVSVPPGTKPIHK